MSQSVPATRDTTQRLSDPKLLPQRVYVLRILGMGLGVLPMAMVLRELGSGFWAWAYLAFSGLLWPHLAYAIAIYSADGYRAERRNLLIDSALAGACVPLMHFNLLPSVMLVTVVTADRINTGIRGLWARSLPALALGVIVGGLFTRFAVSLDTSRIVLLSTLPMLVGYTMLVSLNAYRLVRRVQAQNRRLAELGSIDALTGLYNRGHWQSLAEQVLTGSANGGGHALVLVDIDQFKSINDCFGHAAGDDVLIAVSSEIKAVLGSADFAGRIGGDEFAIVFHGDGGTAEAMAERLRDAVAQLRFPDRPALQCSISLGVADRSDTARDIRAWIEAADRALYLAKSAGRNQSARTGGTGPGKSPTARDR